jgi:hypothetical protein
VEIDPRVERPPQPPAPLGQPAPDTTANPSEDAANIVATARAAGAILYLVEQNSLFAIEWRTSSDATDLANSVRARLAQSHVPAESIDAEVAKVVSRIERDSAGDSTAAVPLASATAVPEPVRSEVPNHSPPGTRCTKCNGEPDGKEKPFIRGSETVWLHQECVRFYSKTQGPGGRTQDARPPTQGFETDQKERNAR